MGLATEWIQRKFASTGLIILYQRVPDQDVDPWSITVSTQHLAEQLEALHKETNPISLRQLFQTHENGKIPDPAVAITFDGGYADNFNSLRPLLKQYSIPVTVFVASGHMGNE